MNDLGYIFGTFVAMMIVSFGQRALPFAASGWLQRQNWAKIVARFLPLAVMTLLVIHSSTEEALSHEGLPIPEITGVVVTLLLQWFVKNSLLSIFTGTFVYVLLLNLFFV